MGVRVQLIGLVGSGKSYLAHRLAAVMSGYVVSFAEGVYRIASMVKGAPIDKTLRSDRELLKLIGTTWGREATDFAHPSLGLLDALKPADWGSPDIWANMFIANCRR